VGASFRRHEDEFTLLRDDPAFFQNRHTSSQGGAELVTKTRPRSGLELALGGELFADLLRSNSLGDRTEGRGALFGELMAGRGESGVISLGLRGDWREGFGAFLSPSLSGSLRFGGSLRLRTAIGRSFRAPTFTERYYTDPANRGRENLEPERAWSEEVGADFLGEGGLRLSITLFARQAEDLIDWARGVDAPEGEPWETRNVEEADFRGVEADLSTPGPLGTELILGGMLLSVDSKESQGFRSKYALRPLLERVSLKVRKRFRDRLSLALNGQRSRRGGEDPFFRIDLRVGVRVAGAWLYVDAANLTDERYPDITGAVAPGRALFVGLEVGGER
jgi:iron complex outermembrane receptor protein